MNPMECHYFSSSGSEIRCHCPGMRSWKRESLLSPPDTARIVEHSLQLTCQTTSSNLRRTLLDHFFPSRSLHRQMMTFPSCALKVCKSGLNTKTYQATRSDGAVSRGVRRSPSDVTHPVVVTGQFRLQHPVIRRLLSRAWNDLVSAQRTMKLTSRSSRGGRCHRTRFSSGGQVRFRGSASRLPWMAPTTLNCNPKRDAVILCLSGDSHTWS